MQQSLAGAAGNDLADGPVMSGADDDERGARPLGEGV